MPSSSAKQATSENEVQNIATHNAGEMEGSFSSVSTSIID